MATARKKTVTAVPAKKTRTIGRKPATGRAAAKKSATSGAPRQKPATEKKPAQKARVADFKPIAPVRAHKRLPAGRPSTENISGVKNDKLEKGRKPKLVRDSFTIPKSEYLVLDELKLRAAKLTRPAKKSELLRAGIKILAALSDAALLAALEQVPAIKTGRPALN